MLLVLYIYISKYKVNKYRPTSKDHGQWYYVRAHTHSFCCPLAPLSREFLPTHPSPLGIMFHGAQWAACWRKKPVALYVEEFCIHVQASLSRPRALYSTAQNIRLNLEICCTYSATVVLSLWYNPSANLKGQQSWNNLICSQLNCFSGAS